MWLYVLVNLLILALVLKFVSDIALAVWCNAVYGVPYVPTNMKLVREMVGGLNLKKGAKVIELGSGDGRVLVEMGKKYQIEGVGYEKNKLLLWMSDWRWKLTWPKRGKVRFESGDLFSIDLKGVDVVYMYLLPWMIEKLRGRLEKELKKGALVISFDYPMKSQKFEMVRLVGRGKQKIAIYRYI